VKSAMLARVRGAVAVVLRHKGYVSVVDVLVEMKRLTPAHLEDWRFGRIPYLERVVAGNLSKLSLIGREIRRVARAQGLKPSVTVYRKWGKGPKRTLRFSRSGEPSVEQAYATHWLSKRGRTRSPQREGAAGGHRAAETHSRPGDEAKGAASPE
jgi:hypothetical protein